MTLYYFILFALALGATWWIFKKVLKIALTKNIVDNPDERKLQKVPVPVLGGAAVFFGIVVSMTATGLFWETASLYAVLGVLVIMLYVGIMDDILSLSPVTRFVVEILGVLLLMFCNGYSLNDFHGLWGIYAIPAYVAVPLTVFACVGILNAINLIDGVNGLSSGYCITACALFASVFIWAGDREAASIAVASIGALVPFFCHNVFGKRSKMYIGDGGTMLMGTIMSTFVLCALNSDSILAAKVPANFGLIPFTLAVLSIPVFDTLRVMALRLSKGKSPFSPDRTHLHHLLFNLGFSHIGVTLFELISNLAIVLGWWIAYRAGASADVQLYVVVIMGVMATFGFYGLVQVSQKKNLKFFSFMQKVGACTHVKHLQLFKDLRGFLDGGCAGLTSESDDDNDN